MAEKMAAICIRAALNLHTDEADPILIIMFSVITRPQYIKNSVAFMFITTSQCSPTHISPCPSYLDCVPETACLVTRGLCKHCQAAKYISTYSERLVPGINQIII